ncbi:MFS transporter [Kineococcus rubinsiae]|uniref:MFS transporter n=1 Tax=Kineococcus rubinsiae TaxID=2609562 RepID=UPI001430D64F|nr:MFS transporter [Kineococcus rubinsiae]NIZ90239.1 MFS transporter [Kineococcus rubinsiae]
MTPAWRLRWLLLAHTVSATGNTATFIALPLYVYASTGSAALLGVLGAAAVAPVVVGGVFGGVLVDRFGYRRTSVVSDAVGAVTIGAVPLLAATTGLPFAGLIALVVATGLLDTPGQAARHAMLPELAADAGAPLERATGWMDAAERAARLLGAPAAGGLVAAVGAPVVLVLDAATFVVAALLVAAAVPAVRATAAGATAVARTPAPAGGGWRGYRRDLAEGLAFVRQDRLLRAIVGMVLLTNAFDAAWSSVVLPLHAARHLGGGTALGLLVAAFGGGAVVGAVVFGAVGARFSRRTVFGVAFLLAGGPRFLVLATSPSLGVLLLVLALAGVAAGALNPILGAAQLQRVPAAARARVGGVVGAGAWAGMPLGTLVAGFWLERGSLTALLLVLGGAYLLVTLLPFVAPAWRELDRVPAAPAALQQG